MSELVRMVRAEPTICYPGDVAAIRAGMNALGFDASEIDIQAAYQQYSEDEMCAGWIAVQSFATFEDAARATMRYLVAAPPPAPDATAAGRTQ